MITDDQILAVCILLLSELELTPEQIDAVAAFQATAQSETKLLVH